MYPSTQMQSVFSSLASPELVPAGHAEHSPAPGTALYVPASHALHAIPSNGPLYPAKHTQSATSSLPSAELVCEGHTVQFPARTVALYSPASQALHATPSDAAVYPATHTQSVSSSLPDAELVCEGHVVQLPAAMYIPISHGGSGQGVDG